MNTLAQHSRTKRLGNYAQNLLPFGTENNMNEETMALADRIRVILGDMDGPEYGKQARLARIAGCGRPVINHWLSGDQVKIRSEHALAIANAFGYRLEWLLEGKGPKKKGEKEIDEGHSEKLFMVHVNEKEMSVLSAYRRGDAHDRSIIETICSRIPDDRRDN